MKKSLALIFISAVFIFLTGCATNAPIGSIYTDIKLPVDVTSNSGQYTKVGTAECTSILTLFAMGDASIEAAKKNAGITKVYHVDWEANNILGIIGKYKVTVYGE